MPALCTFKRKARRKCDNACPTTNIHDPVAQCFALALVGLSGTLDPELLDALCRLVRLLGDPALVRLTAPLVQRESMGRDGKVHHVHVLTRQFDPDPRYPGDGAVPGYGA